MSEKLDRFVDLLRKIFELDKSDLDFGIYRIMNIRKGQIDSFLSQTLPRQVREILEPVADNNIDKIRKRIKELERQAASFGGDAEQHEEYKPLKEQLLISADITALETDVYTYLYSFFSRYYDEGDFISKRRYKEGVYAIPYEGEEVKLYWANQDQYYIKTTENFKDYSFISDGITVHFMLVDATTEQNNNKENGKKRAFMLFIENDKQPGIKTFEKKDNEFFIHFVYDLSEETQKELNDKNYTVIKKYIVDNHDKFIPLITPSISINNEQKSPIQKHLCSYVAKNTFDYFIHKDLGGFLSRELDFFIKNEILHLDDIDSEKEDYVNKYLAKVRATRNVGRIIIDFLAQIENFQKRLWLKKKFVVRTDYCITLDKVPEEYYDEIRNNKAQVQEWIDLYAIDKLTDNGSLELIEKWTNPPSVGFLKANKNLVLDTKYFSPIFKEKIISTIDQLDDTINGELIYGENFQALNLLSEKYDKKVKLVYIDPPFNLGENADYLYKVNYKDSSWLTLLENRLNLSKKLLEKDSSIFVRCSHDGNMILRMLLNEVFGQDNYRNEIILRRAEESKGDLNKQFETLKSITVNYDNLYWFSKNKNSRFGKILKPLTTSKSESHWHSFWKAENRPNMRYDILGIDLSNHYGQWMWSKDRAKIAIDNYKYFQESIESNGISLEQYWLDNGERLEFIRRNGNTYSSVQYWIPPRTEVMADTNWLDIKGYANKWGFKTENSEGSLKRIIESLTSENDYCLDYFIGSGTTAAVAHKLHRKWLGIEMGEHFNFVTLPRLKSVLNGEESGISDETNWFNGGLFKYFQIEDYDDTLSNIEYSDKADTKSLAFGDDYLINYMFNVETKGSLLNIDKFKEPFDYRLKITERNKVKETSVDLVETFNYLLGLNVVKNDALRFYKAVKNNDKDYEGSFDLKEDKNGDFMFKQIKGHLNDGSRILVIWRNITDNLLESNSALDAYFQRNRPSATDWDFDIVYINGDNNIENLRLDNERWKVKIIEKEFIDRMFED